MKYFVMGVTARTAADMLGIHRNSAIRFFRKLRERVAHAQRRRGGELRDVIKPNENMLSDEQKRKRKRGRGRVAVLSIVGHDGKVYTQVMPDARANALMRDAISPDKIIHTSAPAPTEGSNRRMNHGKNAATFWHQAKEQLRQYNGIPGARFDLFLKECEWRFNTGSPKQLLADLKKPLRENY